MKFVMVVLSGVADLPTSTLGGKTPLATAKKPVLDALAARGRVGSIAQDSQRPTGSDVALLQLFGYDALRYPLRRGPLEAIGAGLEFGGDDLVIRGNFVSLYNESIQDLTGGRITDREAEILLPEIARTAADPDLHFHHLRGYRFLVVVRGGAHLRVSFMPPHDVAGLPVRERYPQGADAQRFERVLDRSREILENHDINKVRVDLGENPANFVWLWGAGNIVELPSFQSVFGLKSAAIAGSALARGLGECLRMTVPEVPGATGDLETDLSAKAQAAIAALEHHDVVFVHVQAANEASHLRDPKRKVQCIQDADKKLIAPLADELARYPAWRLLVASDHVSASAKEEAIGGRAPFLIAGSDIATVRAYPFDEEHAAQSDLQIDVPTNLMEFFLTVRPTWP